MSAELLIQRKGATASITRPTTSKTTGIPVQTYAAHLSGLTVYLQEKSGEESVRYGRESARNFGVAYVKAGYDIQTKDRLVIGGRTWDIQAVRTRGAGRTLQMVLEVQETKGTP